MLNIPNLLSLFRIFAIPFYIYFFLVDEYILSGIIFIIAVSTDLIDGYIARKLNMQTKLGKLIDPLADKLTVISILSLLIYVDFIPKFVAFILLTRELIIFFSSSIAYLLGKNFINPSLLGKISIAILYIALAARILNINSFSNFLLYLVIPLNLISAIDYFVKAYKKNNISK